MVLHSEGSSLFNLNELKGTHPEDGHVRSGLTPRSGRERYNPTATCKHGVFEQKMSCFCIVSYAVGEGGRGLKSEGPKS